ncbi:MAG: DUF3108 domain-containing protein [Candidatus Cloacimonadota bacterium]|nr:DUF3108 domain-containing protein [Candidatus Cloacimonadota bacterium]
MLKHKLFILLFFLIFNNCKSEVIERLNITISYLSLPTATAEIDLEKRDSTQIISANASSKGIVNAIYKIDNKYISICDLSFLPITYEKEIFQKNFQGNKIVEFKSDKSVAKIINLINENEISYPIPCHTYDIFSLLFEIRDLLPVEDSSFYCLANYNIWNVQIKLSGKEFLAFKNKKKECLKYVMKFEKIFDNNINSRTDILTGNLFKKKSRLIFWFSDDEYHIPLKAQYVMFPFSVYWHLISYWHK